MVLDMVFDWDDERPTRTLTTADRKWLLGEAKGKCEYCGVKVTIEKKGITANVHHIKPIEYGGKDTSRNLIVLCPNCHSATHSETDGYSPKELKSKIAYRLNPIKKKSPAQSAKKSTAKVKVAKSKSSKSTKSVPAKAKPKKTNTAKASTNTKAKPKVKTKANTMKAKPKTSKVTKVKPKKKVTKSKTTKSKASK